MRSLNLMKKFTFCYLLIVSLSFMSSQELSFLDNQFGEVNNGSTCNSAVECYLQAINLIKSFKEELKDKFDTEKAELQKKFDTKEAELQKKFDAEKAELQKKFDLERGKSLSLVGQLKFL